MTRPASCVHPYANQQSSKCWMYCCHHDTTCILWQSEKKYNVPSPSRCYIMTLAQSGLIWIPQFTSEVLKEVGQAQLKTHVSFSSTLNTHNGGVSTISFFLIYFMGKKFLLISHFLALGQPLFIFLY